MPLTLSPFDPLDALAIDSPERDFLPDPPAKRDPSVIGWTLHDEYGPIAAAGFRFLGDGQAYVWALLSGEIKRRPFTLHRLVKRQLPILIEKYGLSRLYCDADISNPSAMEWLCHLGFHEMRLMPNAYGIDRDFMLYELLQRSQPSPGRRPRSGAGSAGPVGVRGLAIGTDPGGGSGSGA